MAHIDNTVDPRFVKELIYQPIELMADYEIEERDNSRFVKFNSVNGMRPQYPDANIKESVLLNMIKLNGELEILILVTIYNESSASFNRTLHAIIENLKHLQEDGIDSNHIGCICIIDGMEPFSQNYLKPDQKPFFENFFSEEMIKERFNVKDPFKDIETKETQEIAHCFSFKTDFGHEGYPELQMVFCVKQKRGRKLNSHLWFFGGFCKMIEPKYVMMLDVGTKPSERSLCYFHDTLKHDLSLAGVCGQLYPSDPQYSNIIVSGQAVEYIFLHIFDTALESSFGYIQSMPGGFCAYRWEAIKGSPIENDYFKSIKEPGLLNAFYSNIYSAEDRILPLSIICKVDAAFVVKFVHLAYAEKDVPDKLYSLLAQRRRWINSSFFSLIDNCLNLGKICRSSHSKWRKCWFLVELIIASISMFFSWTMVASFYLYCELIIGNIVESYSLSFTNYYSTTEFAMNFYLGLLIVLFMYSLGVKSPKLETTLKIIAFFFACFMLLGFSILSFSLLSDIANISPFSIFLLASTGIPFIVGLILTGNVKKVLMRIVQFVIFTPVLANMTGIYAVCNINDCSRGSELELMSELEISNESEFMHYRTKWVMVHVLTNMFFYKAISSEVVSTSEQYSLKFFLALGVFLIIIRFFGCLWHYIGWWIKHRNSGTKLLIPLSSAAEIERQNKVLLQRIDGHLNKSVMQGGTRDIRDSILDTMRRREALGKSFNLTVNKMLIKKQTIDQESSQDEIVNQEEEIENQLPNKSKLARTKSMGQAKKGDFSRMLRESLQKMEEEKEEEMNLEDSRFSRAKEFMKNPDVSEIEGRQDSGIFDFENFEGKDNEGAANETIKGVLELDKPANANFNWNDSGEIKVEEAKEEMDFKQPEEAKVELKTEKKNDKKVVIVEDNSDKETENADDADKYLDMLDSIIKNISLDNSMNAEDGQN